MAVSPAEAVNPATVMVAGAGSQIGLFAVRQLLSAGHEVFAVGRSGPRPGLPGLPGVRWMDEAEAAQSIKGCRYLLSTGPLEVAWRLLGAGRGPQSAVVFSSTSVEVKAYSGDKRERHLAARMLKLETELQAVAEQNGARLTIFRPTLVYGCGLDANISRLAGFIGRFGFAPVAGRAEGLRMPVHAADLASVAIRALFCERELPGLLNVAGGETLAYTEMVRRVFQALEKPARLIRLPGWLFAWLAGAVGLLHPGGGINAGMVRRQAIDLVFDDSQARELLGHDPRPFQPSLGDFYLPDSQPHQR